MLASPNKNILILFSTRIIRLFCYGFLSVILVLYLAEAGLTETQAGLLFTFTLAGDAIISLWLTTRADTFGRKKTLILGALLMLGDREFVSVKPPEEKNNRNKSPRNK